jgi:hypothetical protein
MSTFTKSMFDSIKGALSQSRSDNKISEIMKFAPGNSYVVRLLPNVADPSKTFHHYYNSGWESFATGQYMGMVSPTTINERCPMSELYFKVQREGTPADKEKVRAITKRENWLVNAYIINDPVNPDNNDTVKIIRFGKQLHKIIMDAIEGEDSDQLGHRIFDLSDSGCSFRIKVEKQQQFPTYVSSKFLMPGEVPGMTEDKMKEIYDGCHELENVFQIKPYEELQEILNTHYHCIDATTAVPEQAPPSNDYGRKRDEVTDDDVPFDFKSKDSNTSDDDSDDVLEDDKVQELLAGLDE